MSQIFDDQPLGQMAIKSNSAIGTLAVVTGLTVSHKQNGTNVRSTFTLAAVPQSVINGTEYQSTLLFTFPKGEIQIKSVQATLAETTTSAIAGTLNSGVTGAVGVGSTAAVSTTLATTAQNFIPTTAFVTSTVINVAAASVSPILGTGVSGDFFVLGSNTTAAKLYLNSAFATTTDVDADATMTWTGSVTVTWELLSYPMSIFGS